VKSCVKFDADKAELYKPEIIYKKLEKISHTHWPNPFGDGKSSERIATDIIKRVREGKIYGHLPENSHLPVARSFIEDGIRI
jgi:hypothetical protein